MGEIAHIPIKGTLRSKSLQRSGMKNNTIYNVPPMSPIAPEGGIRGGEGGINIYELFFRERIRLGTLPIDDDDDNREKIWFALMKTRLFCSNCCQDYTDSICNNSKIEIK